jgi:hypothetical protein
MTSTDQSSEPTSPAQTALGVEMKLEVVTLPVSDVDQAKSFYQSLGWRLDGDFAFGDDIRAVQLTPPQSGCSISFGKGLTKAEPGSAQRFELVVSDIDAAREDLISRVGGRRKWRRRLWRWRRARDRRGLPTRRRGTCLPGQWPRQSWTSGHSGG